MKNPGMWSHQQTAAYLGIDEQTLHRLNSQGRGPTRYRVGRYNRYRPADVDAWLERLRITR